MEGGPLTRPIVEAFNGLSPQLQTAARYVLDCPDDVALLSMREQARRAGVPPATMTRLAESDAELARGESVSAAELAETMRRRSAGE